MNNANRIIPFECYRHSQFSPSIEIPQSERQIEANAEKARVLYLFGKWQMPGSEFRLEAVLLVGTNGALDGSIKWHNIRTVDLSPTFFANEFVDGQINRPQLEIKGYRAETGIVTDDYQIVLSGIGKSGLFNGKSRAFGDWSGRLEGNYIFTSVGKSTKW